MNRTELAKAFARTYGGDRDPWERVQEYQRVLEYSAEHPNEGSAAVASALDLPRGRIRSWVDSDGMPDPVRGIQACESHSWFDVEWTEPRFTGLNVLVAWIFSGGSINELFVPSFAIDNEIESVLFTAFDHVGVGYRTLREDEQGRATEVRPTEDASPLGRLLVALGAPQGEKTPETSLTLPEYLDEAPFVTRLDFARTYLLNRGVERDDRPNHPVQFREERSKTYRNELRAFFQDLVDDDAIRGGDDTNTTFLTSSAAELLYETPTFAEFETE